MVDVGLTWNPNFFILLAVKCVTLSLEDGDTCLVGFTVELTKRFIDSPY